MKSDNYSLYIVICNDGTLYTGISNNVSKRVETHNTGRGAKYTKDRTPVTLIYERFIGSKSEALKEEFRVKRLGRKEKMKMIVESKVVN